MNPTRTGERMRAVHWMIKRFLPVLLITAGAAVGLAVFRASAIFLIGLQGMVAGGMIGWVSGRISRNDPDEYKTVRQRCWLGVCIMLIYLFTHIVALSIINAGPVDTPLYWLGEIIEGFQDEKVVGIGRAQNYQGRMKSGWWIFMNTIDAGLFWFLFISLYITGGCPALLRSMLICSSTFGPRSFSD